MWKKDEATPGAPRQAEAAPRPEAPRRAGGGQPATIGPSINIKGEVTGDEDLLIQGHVEGSVELRLHAVTVGGDGRVKANITGRVVTIEGEVDGDLRAEEQVVLSSSARVTGDITAPRVVLQDGARFRGLVDMGDKSAGGNAKSAETAGSAAGKDGPDVGTASTPGTTSSQESNGTPTSSKSTPSKGKDASSPVEGAAS